MPEWVTSCPSRMSLRMVRRWQEDRVCFFCTYILITAFLLWNIWMLSQKQFLNPCNLFMTPSLKNGLKFPSFKTKHLLNAVICSAQPKTFRTLAYWKLWRTAIICDLISICTKLCEAQVSSKRGKREYSCSYAGCSDLRCILLVLTHLYYKKNKEHLAERPNR